MKKGEVRKEKNIPIVSSWPQIFRKDHANMYNITIDNSKWKEKKGQKADFALSRGQRHSE